MKLDNGSFQLIQSGNSVAEGAYTTSGITGQWSDIKSTVIP
jgi:hypothetical protein